MDYADLQKVQRLSQEKTGIQRALALFAEGGRINAMVVGPTQPADAEPPPPMVGGVQVLTGYIEYPQQMVDSIKSAFEARQKAITAELEKLGVTGVGEPEKRMKR